MPTVLSPEQLRALLGVISPKKPAPLNLRSGLGSIAGQLRGGLQPASQLLNQLKGRPGVRGVDVQQMLGHLTPSMKVSPSELGAEVRSPKLFAQRSIGNPKLTAEQIDDHAFDLLHDSQAFAPARRLALMQAYRPNQGSPSLPDDMQALYRAAQAPDWGNAVAPSAQQLELQMLNKLFDYNHGVGLDVYHDELYGNEAAWDAARYLARRDTDPGQGARRFGPVHRDSQRQRDAGGNIPTDYFETVLRRSAMQDDPTRGSNKARDHYSNRQQLGHVRGTVTPAGRMALDEIQSDPLEALGAKGMPELHNVHGKLGRMAIERAAAAGLEGVDIPDGRTIGAVRDRNRLPFYQDVYDKELGRTLYEPLQRQGIPVRDDHGWRRIDLPEALRDAILAPDSRVLDYKRGGLVAMRGARHGC